MLDISPSQYNATFASFLDSRVGIDKAAAAGKKVVRDRLREESAARRIINPEPLDPTDHRVVPSLNSDTLVVRKDLEPNSKAVALMFSTQPDAEIVSSKRIDIPIFTISSNVHQIYEDALLAYEAPVTKLVKEHTGKNMQEIEDLEWLTYSEAAVQATGHIVMGEMATADFADAGAATGNRFDIQRPDLVDLRNEMLEDGNRKRVHRTWMNDIDFNNMLKWTVEDVGSDKQSEMVVDGYKYDRLLGMTIVRSIKTDLLYTGNIYAYAEPDFLGFFFILNEPKFYIDKIARLITWQAWESIAICIANISSVAKLELYNGQGAGVPGSDTLATEDDLFTQTNPVFDGGSVYPSITLD